MLLKSNLSVIIIFLMCMIACGMKDAQIEEYAEKPNWRNWMVVDKAKTAANKNEVREKSMKKIHLLKKIVNNNGNRIVMLVDHLNELHRRLNFAEGLDEVARRAPTNTITELDYVKNTKLQTLQIILKKLIKIRSALTDVNGSEKLITMPLLYETYKTLIVNINVSESEEEFDVEAQYAVPCKFLRERSENVRRRRKNRVKILHQIVTSYDYPTEAMIRREIPAIKDDEDKLFAHKLLQLLGKRLTIIIDDMNRQKWRWLHRWITLKKDLKRFRSQSKWATEDFYIYNFEFDLFKSILNYKVTDRVFHEDKYLVHDIATKLVPFIYNFTEESISNMNQLNILIRILHQSHILELNSNLYMILSKTLKIDFINVIKENLERILYETNRKFKSAIPPKHPDDWVIAIKRVTEALKTPDDELTETDKGIMKTIHNYRNRLSEKSINNVAIMKSECNLCYVDGRYEYLTYQYLEDVLFDRSFFTNRVLNYTRASEQTILKHIVWELRISIDPIYETMLAEMKQLSENMKKYGFLSRSIRNSVMRMSIVDPRYLIADVLYNHGKYVEHFQRPGPEIIAYAREHAADGMSLLYGSEICEQMNQIKEVLKNIDYSDDMEQVKQFDRHFVHLIVSSILSLIVDHQLKPYRRSMDIQCESYQLKGCDINAKVDYERPQKMQRIKHLLLLEHRHLGRIKFEDAKAFEYLSNFYDHLSAKTTKNETESEVLSYMDAAMKYNLETNYAKSKELIVLNYLYRVAGDNLYGLIDKFYLSDKLIKKEMKFLRERTNESLYETVRSMEDRGYYMSMLSCTLYKVIRLEESTKLETSHEQKALRRIEKLMAQYLHERLVRLEKPCFMLQFHIHLWQQIYAVYDKFYKSSTNRTDSEQLLFMLSKHLKWRQSANLSRINYMFEKYNMHIDTEDLCIPGSEILYPLENDMFNYIINKYFHWGLPALNFTSDFPQPFLSKSLKKLFTKFYRLPGK